MAVSGLIILSAAASMAIPMFKIERNPRPRADNRYTGSIPTCVLSKHSIA